jgi:PmbA protein
MSISETVERVLDMAASRVIECEVYGEDVESFQAEVFEGRVESVDRAREAGVGVRAVSGGRAGFAWTCDLSDGGLGSLLEEAAANSLPGDASDEDVLAPGSSGDIPPVERRYPSDEPPAGKISGALEMEQAALGADPRIRGSEGASYSEDTWTVCVGGTRGFLRTRRGGYCSCAIGASARSGTEVRSGWSYAQAPLPGMLDFRAAGEEAGRRAAGLIGGRPLPTGRYAAVFDPLAFTEIVSLLAEILSAEMVVRSSSVFAGRLGERVASPLLSLVDDPFLEGGCFSAPFDDEGVPACRRELISGGVLSDYLHNSYTVRKMGGGRAGSAFRGSFKGIPAPSPTNIFVEPGGTGTDGLVDSVGSGIYIQDVMGMHTADTVSGDFSVGITGHEIRGGRVERPVCEMTISGNVVSLLESIEATGSDVTFAGRTGSPAVLAGGLSVSGS